MNEKDHIEWRSTMWSSLTITHLEESAFSLTWDLESFKWRISISAGRLWKEHLCLHFAFYSLHSNALICLFQRLPHLENTETCKKRSRFDIETAKTKDYIITHPFPSDDVSKIPEYEGSKQQSNILQRSPKFHMLWIGCELKCFRYILVLELLNR